MNKSLIPLHPHTNIFAVEVPASCISTKINNITGNLMLTDESGYVFIDREYDLKDYKLLGTVKNKVIDFDCEEYVKELSTYKDWFSHNPMYETDAEQECFLSLMESNNLDLTKHYVILEKI